MTALVDDEARDVIRTALDLTLVVEAAAGTGKTTELVKRIVALLASGLTTVERIVAVTFTEKAAGELKLRLRSGLEQARAECRSGDRSRRHLEQALAHLEEARVSTIHGFCADLLRERPVEARVDPQFRVMDEAGAERLYAQVFDLWLQRQLEEPPPGLRRALRREANFRFDDTAAGRLRRAGWTLANWRDFPSPWQRPEFEREAAIDRLIDLVHAFAALSERCGRKDWDTLFRTTGVARRLSSATRTAEAARGRDYDSLEAGLAALAADRDFGALKGFAFQYGPDLTRGEVTAALGNLKEQLEAFTRDADADLAAWLRDELFETVALYEQAKARAGCLDFLDLLLRARNLVRDDRRVRFDLQRRFTHLFVDEFQDTDPLQAELLMLLAADDPEIAAWRDVVPVPGRLFIVGDPKQSIYRFRRADVGIYEEVKERLLAEGAQCIHLTTSFRSVPSIQHAVNTAFSGLMTGDRERLQATYVPLSPFRDDVADQPSLIALPVPKPYGRRDVTRTAIEASLPDAVAAFVEWLLEHSGWKVSERERPRERVPIAARHVCLLFRRFQSWGDDVTRGYVRALEARGIHHLLVGGRSFHQREEIETLRAALAAIEWPDDELSVFATLHGSLFAIGDEELLEYRHLHGRLRPLVGGESGSPPLSPIPATEEGEGGGRDADAAAAETRLQPVVDALKLLGQLHANRNHCPVGETIAQLLESTRAHAGFALRPSGEQALANVLHLTELARVYEAQGGISFRGFVERLREDAEGGQSPEAPILEEGSDGVRLMTVHKAKGLEFPVVILADITARPAQSRADRHLEPEAGLCAVRIGGWSPRELLDHELLERSRDEAEGVRVAYVAATRARDLLVVPAVGDKPFAGGWASGFNAAIYPPEDMRQRSTTAPGCPLLGRETVMNDNRPDGFVPQQPPMRPGLHAMQGYDVTWWDPRVLKLDVEPRFGIRRQELIGKEAEPGVVEADAAAYHAWRAARDGLVARGSAPALAIDLVTARAERGGVLTDRVSLAGTEREASRPSGKRFGTLVHTVLASISLRASVASVQKLATQHGRLLGSTPAEVTACVVAVERALAHPLLTRARRAAAGGFCRREVPVSVWDPDEACVFDGVVDLAFCEDERWTVIDFKTDREVSAPLPVYRRQVALYARAIEASTGQPANGVLLFV